MAVGGFSVLEAVSGGKRLGGGPAEQGEDYPQT